MDSKPLKGSMNGVTSNGVFEALDETAVTYRLNRTNAPAVAEVMRRLMQEGKIPVLVDGFFSAEIYNCCGLLMDYSGVDPQPYGFIWNCHIAGEDDNGEEVSLDRWITYSNPTLLRDENEEEQEYDPEQDEWHSGTNTNEGIIRTVTYLDSNAPNVRQLLNDYEYKKQIIVCRVGDGIHTRMWLNEVNIVPDPTASDTKAIGLRWIAPYVDDSGNACWAIVKYINETLKETYTGSYDAAQDTWSTETIIIKEAQSPAQ